MRLKFGSGAPWENEIGYSRAVRVGNHIVVSGTAAVDETGEVAYPDDAYRQTIAALEIVRKAVERAGGSVSDVVRTRMYIVRDEDWDDVGRAHGEFFAQVRPATSMVRVAGLISREMRVEVEAEAILSAPPLAGAD